MRRPQWTAAVGSVAVVVAMPWGPATAGPAPAGPAPAAHPTCAGVPATIVGTAGGDRIVGTAHRDVIAGLGGDDTIIARGGRDLVCGGPGDDTVSGDAGDDQLRGGPGRDALYGGWGADRLRGGTGTDRLWGGRGADVLVGWRGDDRLRGGPGSDRVDGGPGIDLCLSPPPPGARRCENTKRVVGSIVPGPLALSAHGRFVAFASASPDLVAGDTNGAVDAFVLDRRRHVTRRVSVASDGHQAAVGSVTHAVAISAHGARVAFASDAGNLVAGDTNRGLDVFVHDVRTGVTRRVSVATGGGQADGSSGFDRVALSADGRFVVFVSDATDLVPGDTNGVPDVFVHDMRTGATTRVSVASDGSQAAHFSGGLSSPPGSRDPAVSADGRYVAFDSDATDLVPGDANDATDVFVHDRRTGITRRVFVPRSAQPAGNDSFRPAISAHGRYVAFESESANVVRGDTNDTSDVFERDRRTGATRRVSVATDGSGANGRSIAPAVSAGGRFVTFASDATNLVGHDTNAAGDVFAHDVRTGRTTRVSVLASGRQLANGASGGSEPVTMSADGCCATFSTFAPASNSYDLSIRLLR